jgi:hypothetical protein
MSYVQTECAATTEDTIIIKDKPDYNIIFVIGNSGRFLDPWFDGKQSSSHIVWQRINAKDGLAIDILKDSKPYPKDGKALAALHKKILDADNTTAYGFAELSTYTNDKLVVEFKELDKIKDPNAPHTVLKITLEKTSGDKAKSVPEYALNNLNPPRARKLK